jgi:hypothetical protein
MPDSTNSNESQAALNRAITHGHAQREDDGCARTTRETRQVFIEAVMQCELFDLTLELLLKLRTQDDSQQSRTMQALQEKATLKELEEASPSTASNMFNETSHEASSSELNAKCCMQVAASTLKQDFYEQALLSLMERWYKPI